mmetsp:Transcript_9750/g.21042  ORF Transcript_9750/g.21042 Transcript_9750/m.21042 type:complete len:318 (-) Transcript_9750:1173-2126(-)
MTEITSTKTIADYLTAKDVKPITNKWIIIDIRDFCTAIANALTNITSIYTDKVAKDIGHAYLVDKTLQYRKRCEGESAQLPAPQTRPVEPTNQNAYAHKQYLYHMKPYRLSQALDKEARRLITTKSPGCLEGLLCPLTGSLSLSLTARQAFDHIEEAVQATSTGNMRHQELLQALIMREYEPGITTAETYFRLCEIDQHCMRAIRAAKVPDAQIMVGYKSPFERLWIVPLCKSLTMHGPRSRRHHHMPRLPLPTGTLKPTTVKTYGNTTLILSRAPGSIRPPPLLWMKSQPGWTNCKPRWTVIHKMCTPLPTPKIRC